MQQTILLKVIFFIYCSSIAAKKENLGSTLCGTFQNNRNSKKVKPILGLRFFSTRSVHPDFVSGFTDGVGSFSITLTKDQVYKCG